MLHKLKLLDNIIIPKYVWFLEIYYVFGYLINAVAHYYTIKNFPEIWNLQGANITLNELILPILISIITGIFILLFIPECQGRKSKNYIYIVPTVIFLTSIVSNSLIPSGLNIGFIGFLATISFFIFISLLILFYDEPPTNEKALELMHSRYLQFLQSFVWLIIIGGTWFVVFILQLMPPQKTPMFQTAFSIGAFQYLFVGGVGLLLVAYSFNKRLRDIENKLDGSHRENRPK
jgi:hypothetical protein